MTLPFVQNVGQIPYATSVSAALAQIWLWDPSFALNQDPEAYEKQTKDLIISGAMDHLQRSIVGHSFSFEPEEDGVGYDAKKRSPEDSYRSRKGRDLARVIELLTKQQRFFPQSLYNLTRATHRGAAWARIYPEVRELRIFDGKPRKWTVIAKVKDVDKRRFRLSQVPSGLAISLPGSNPSITSAKLQEIVEKTPGFNSPVPGAVATGYESSLGNFRWEFWRGYGAGQSGLWWSPLEQAAPLDHWIMHAPDTTEWGLGYGYGLADELQAFFWLKGTFLRWAAQAAERFGQGFLIAKTKALRDLMAKGYSQAAAMAATVAVMRTWRSENVVAVDENTEIDLKDLPGEGMRWIYEWVKYLDNGMRQRILAALQPTGSGDGDGGFSSAKVEEGSTDAMVAYLRSPLEETWTWGPVRFLVEHNEENLRELGLWGIGIPRLRLKGREQRDVDKMLKVFDFAFRAKIPVRLEDFYSVFNLTAPNEEDEAIQYPEGPEGFGLDDAGKPFGGETGSEPDGDEGRLPIGEGRSSVAETNGSAKRNGAAA